MAAALDYMHCGDLVPDSTVREMVRERGCLLVLDGFPGTLGQDETLSQLMEKENLELSAVVNYDTEHFPPGLQKRVQPCSREMEHMLPPPPPDCTHVVIGGHFVSLNKRTDVVMDIFHFEM
jgi:hypothetical protein